MCSTNATRIADFLHQAFSAVDYTISFGPECANND